MTIQIPKWGLAALMLVVVFGLGVGLGALLFSGDGDTSTVASSSAPGETANSGAAAEDTEGELETSGDCDELGINGDEMREGDCSENGTDYRVVNRDSTLQLPELSAKLAGIELTDAVGGQYESETADGTFAVFTLEIKNKLHTPTEFDEYQEQVSLLVNGNTYTQDFDAENGPLENSFLWMGEAIQPEATETGAVVFDLPKPVARKVEDEGNLQILNFSDTSSYGGTPSKPVGVIRTYPPHAT
jgi:Domain of unknown function (DUF4352)